MLGGIIFLGVLAFIGLVIMLIVVASRQAEKRRAERRQLARSLGMRYNMDDHFGLPGMLSHIERFSQGHSHEAKNVIDGSYGDRQVFAFDFKYTTTSTSTDSKGHRTTSDSDWWFSTVVHRLELPFPQLQIRPENFFDKISGFFGFDDIDFESDEFSRKFHVNSESRKFAYDVCHPRMMEWLLANRGWTIQLVGGYFVLTAGSTWSAGEFHSALEFTNRFFEMIPDFVIRELKRG